MRPSTKETRGEQEKGRRAARDRRVEVKGRSGMGRGEGRKEIRGKGEGEGGEGHPLIRSNSKSLMNHQLRFSGEYVNIYLYLRKKYPLLKYL